MADKFRCSTSDLKRGAIYRWWSGALLAAGVAMMLGAASCGGGSGGGSSFVGAGDGVWVADPAPSTASGAPQIDEFTTGQLNGNGDPTPRKQLLNAGSSSAGIPAFTSVSDVLFDPAGNLWAVDSANVFEFAKASLSGNGNVLPSFFISAADFAAPDFAVFDSAGNLWVSDTLAIASHHDIGGLGEIFEFSAAQLGSGTSGQVTPAVTLVSGTFQSPLGMAFDSKGDLWIANNGIADDESPALLEISKATLSAAEMAGGVYNPDFESAFTAVATSEGGLSLAEPWGLSFDGSGNLWVSNEEAVGRQSGAADPAAAPGIGQGTIVEFAASVISAGGTAAPTPATTVVPVAVGANVSLANPEGISVDVKRNTLITANEQGASLSQFNLSSIPAGGGAVHPNGFASGSKTTLGFPEGLIVGPVH